MKPASGEYLDDDDGVLDGEAEGDGRDDHERDDEDSGHLLLVAILTSNSTTIDPKSLPVSIMMKNLMKKAAIPS